MSIFDVGFEVGGLRKRLCADGALEGSKATVRIRVPLQLGRRDEGLAALFAFVPKPTIVSDNSQVVAATAATEAATAAQKAIWTSEDLKRGEAQYSIGTSRVHNTIKRIDGKVHTHIPVMKAFFF